MDFKEMRTNMKYKAQEFGAGMKKSIRDTIVFCEEHPLAVTMAVGLAAKGYNLGMASYKTRQHEKVELQRQARVAQEQLMKACSVYDNSAGVYLETVRPMTQAERTEYSVRRHSNEKPVDILRDMRLL